MEQDSSSLDYRHRYLLHPSQSAETLHEGRKMILRAETQMRLHPELSRFLETYGSEQFFYPEQFYAFMHFFLKVRTVNLVIMQREFKTEN